MPGDSVLEIWSLCKEYHKISPQERFMIMRAFERGLRGYTYLNVARNCSHAECRAAGSNPAD